MTKLPENWFLGHTDDVPFQECVKFLNFDERCSLEEPRLTWSFWRFFRNLLRQHPFEAGLLINKIRDKCAEIVSIRQSEQTVGDVFGDEHIHTKYEQMAVVCTEMSEQLHEILTQQLMAILERLAKETTVYENREVDALKLSLSVILTSYDTSTLPIESTCKVIIELCNNEAKLEILPIYLALLSSCIENCKDFVKEDERLLLKSSLCGLPENTSHINTTKKLFVQCVQEPTHFLTLTFARICESDDKKHIEWASSVQFLSVFQRWVTSNTKSSELVNLQEFISDRYCYVDCSLVNLASQKQSDMMVAEWCINHFAPLNLNKFLILLENHSPLYSIHYTIPLSKIAHDDILQLLSRDATFNNNVELKESSIATYSAYSVIQRVLQVITAGINLDLITSMWREKTFNGVRPTIKSRLARLTSSADKTACVLQYETKVVDKWPHIVRTLNLIQPLAFRLEVIENVYSLIFLQHNHLSGDAVHDISADDNDCSASSVSAFGSEVPSCSGSAPIAHHVIAQSAANEKRDRIPRKKDSTQLLKPESSLTSQLSDFARQGFLINDLVAWDLLLILNEAIANMRVDKKWMYVGDNQVSWNSISPKDVEGRLLNVEKHIHDALRRIKLLHPTPREIGSSAEMDHYIFGTLFPSVSASDVYEEGSVPAATTRTRKVRSRSKGEAISSGSQNWTLLDYLTAPPSELLRIVLLCGDFDMAKQIVGTYRLENTHDCTELRLNERVCQLFSNFEPTLNSDLSEDDQSWGDAEQKLELALTAIVGQSQLPKMLIDTALTLKMPHNNAYKLTVAAVKSTRASVGLPKSKQYIIENAFMEFVNASESFGQTIYRMATWVKDAQEPFIVCSAKNVPRLLTSYHPLNYATFEASSRTWSELIKEISLIGNLCSRHLCSSSGVCDISKQLVSRFDVLSMTIMTLAPIVSHTTSMNTPLRAYCRTFSRYADLFNKTLDQFPSKSVVFDQKMDIMRNRPVFFFGDLLFEKQEQPACLERFANEMEIDLLGVIVDRTCVSIPLNTQCVDAHNRQDCVDDFGCYRVGQLVVLNGGKMVSYSKVKGQIICRELLKCLLDTLQDTLQPIFIENMNGLYGRVVSADTVGALLKDSQLHKCLTETSELCSVDLTALESPEERFCFFVNLANLMMIHTAIVNPLIFGAGQRGCLASCYIEQTNAMTQVGYVVGELGFVSLYDVRCSILKLTDFSTYVPQELRVLEQYTFPPHLYCRIPFLVSDGSVCSPRIRVIVADTLSSQINKAMQEYFDLYNVCGKSAPHRTVMEFLVTSPNGITEAVDILKQSFGVDLSGFVHTVATNYATQRYASRRQILIHALDEPPKKLKQQITALPHTMTKQRSLVHSIPKNVHDYIRRECALLHVMLQDIGPSGLFQQIRPMTAIESDSFNLIYWHNLLKSSQLQKLQECLNCSWQDVISQQCLTQRFIFEQIATHFTNKTRMDTQSYSVYHLLDALPTTFYAEFPEMYALKGPVAAKCSQMYQHFDLAVYAISDPKTMLHCGMERHQEWSLEVAHHWLSYLLCNSDISPQDRHWIVNRQDQLFCYEKIFSLPLCPWASWPDISDESVQNPSEIIQLLMREQGFQLISCWSNCHVVPNNLRTYADVSSLRGLLCCKEPNLVGAQLFFDVMQSSVLINAAELLLGGLTAADSRHFVISQVISRIKQDPSLERQTKLNLFALRQEAIGLILTEDVSPAEHRSQIAPLRCTPYLILEQWIMNLQLSLVQQAIPLVKDYLDDIVCKHIADTQEVPADELVQDDCLCWDHFNAMIEKYCMKAVERPDSVCLSWDDTVEDSSEQVPCRAASKAHWQKDKDITTCTCCSNVDFSLFVRKHHCRRCGRVVCSSCSTNRCVLDGVASVAVRVCEICFDHIKRSPCKTRGHVVERKPLDTMTSSRDCDIRWYLSANKQHNTGIRREFSFDSVPCVSLFQAILNLHGDSNQSALYIISLLLKLFASLIQSFSTPTLDSNANFILSMAHTLLGSAKVKFTVHSNYNGIEFCDYYCRWVDLLQLLLKHSRLQLLPAGCLQNMFRIMTIQRLHLLQPDHQNIACLNKYMNTELRYMQRLRDNLVQKQSWNLALNVSTKAGLISTSVWSSWGMSCLKAGRFSKARQYFARVLKKSHDPYSNESSPLLREILSYLQRRPFDASYASIDQMQTTNNLLNKTSKAIAVSSILNRLSDVTKGKLEKAVNGSHLSIESGWIDPIFKLECQHYLHHYGTHRMYLLFACKHDMLQEAVTYVEQHAVRHSMFHNEVLLPALKSDNLPMLIETVKRSSLAHYLTLSCKAFENECQWHNLVLLQKLLGDQLRASMTLIRIYVQQATTFTTLSHRKHYLTEAADILVQYVNASPVTLRSGNAQKNKNVWTINSQINCIRYQIDVANYLAQIEQQNAQLAKDLQTVRLTVRTLVPCTAASQAAIPTVFNRNERLVLAVVAVCAGTTVETGLAYACQMVEKTAISAQDLLKCGACALTTLGREHHAFQFIQGVLQWGFILQAQLRDLIWPALRHVKPLSKHVPSFLSLFTCDQDKIDLLIQIGNLRQAYVLTVQVNSNEGMLRLLEAANQSKQHIVSSLCRRWIHGRTKTQS